MFWVNLFTMIICCTMIVAAIVKDCRRNGREYCFLLNQPKMNNGEKHDKYIFAVAVVILVTVRLIDFGIVPGGYNPDTVMAAVEAKSLAECGVDLSGMAYPVLFEAYGYGQMSVLMSYLMIPFIKLGGLNLVTITLPILLFSIIGSLALWGVVKEVFGFGLANVVLFIVGINPWHFMQSRWALDCNMLPHIFICGIYLLCIFIRKKKAVYLYGSMIVFAISMYAYSLSFISVPVFLLATCVIFIKSKIVNWKQALTSVGIYICFAWPIYLCMIINALKLNAIITPFCTIPFLAGNTRSNDMVFFVENPIQQLFENIKTLIYVVLYRHDNLLWNCIDGFGTIYVCTLPFVFLGMFLIIKAVIKEKDVSKKSGYLLLVVFYFSSLCTGVITNVNINRVNVIFYEHIIFAGIGIYYVVNYLKKSIWIIGAVYTILFILFLNCYFTDWNEAFNKRFDKDMMDAIEYASEYNADEYHINAGDTYVIFGFDLEMNYYYGKTDYFTGKEIAYKKRFIYDEVKESVLNAGENDKSIVYVQKQSEKVKFPNILYKITDFGDWFVAISEY